MATSPATRGAQPSTDVEALRPAEQTRASADPFDTAGIRDRIRTALEQLGMNQSVLARQSGLSETSMSRLMHGKRDISAGELGAMARALRKSVSWLAGDTFTGDDGPTDSPAAIASPVHSRTLAFAARLVDQQGVARAAGNDALVAATRRAMDLISTEAELDLLVSAPAPQLPAVPPLPQTTYKKRAGKQMAERVREAFGLGMDPIEDFTAFASATFGLRVAREPLGKGLAGLLVADTTHQPTSTASGVEAAVPALALISTFESRLGRQRYTAAHELAHLLFGDARDDLHTDYVDVGRDEDHVEKRAQEFAAELLMPAAGVLALVEQLDVRRLSEQDRKSALEDGEVDAAQSRRRWCRQLVATVATHFGSSVESAAIRCEVLGIITETEKRQVWSMKASTVLRASGFDAYDEADEAAIGVTDPPESLSGKALYAYTERLVGIDLLGRVWNTEDLAVLRDELAEAGWGPTLT